MAHARWSLDEIVDVLIPVLVANRNFSAFQTLSATCRTFRSGVTGALWSLRSTAVNLETDYVGKLTVLLKLCEFCGKEQAPAITLCDLVSDPEFNIEQSFSICRDCRARLSFIQGAPPIKNEFHLVPAVMVVSGRDFDTSFSDARLMRKDLSRIFGAWVYFSLSNEVVRTKRLKQLDMRKSCAAAIANARGMQDMSRYKCNCEFGPRRAADLDEVANV